jgi:hypothetical protein
MHSEWCRKRIVRLIVHDFRLPIEDVFLSRLSSKDVSTVLFDAFLWTQYPGKSPEPLEFTLRIFQHFVGFRRSLWFCGTNVTHIPVLSPQTGSM